MWLLLFWRGSQLNEVATLKVWKVISLHEVISSLFLSRVLLSVTVYIFNQTLFLFSVYSGIYESILFPVLSLNDLNGAIFYFVLFHIKWDKVDTNPPSLSRSTDQKIREKSPWRAKRSPGKGRGVNHGHFSSSARVWKDFLNTPCDFWHQELGWKSLQAVLWFRNQEQPGANISAWKGRNFALIYDGCSLSKDTLQPSFKAVQMVAASLQSRRWHRGARSRDVQHQTGKNKLRVKHLFIQKALIYW